MNQTSLSAEIANYIAGRCSRQLEKLTKEAERQRKNLADDPVALAQFEAQFSQQLADATEKYQPANWLDDAARRAGQMSLVTHAPKYTHSHARSSGVRVETQVQTECYLVSAALRQLTNDFIGNAAALDVANLLLLTAQKESLIEAISQGDITPLRPFAYNETQLAEWLSGFSQVLKSPHLTSHTLSKQIYFPSASQHYHLLGPLFASSLAQALHERIDHSRFGEVAKAARQARRDNHYSANDVVQFTHLAIQNFGGTKHQGISLLNIGRRGKAYLLNAQPPQWQSKSAPPQKDKQFWRQYSWRVRTLLAELKKYLLEVRTEESTLSIRQFRAGLVAQLVAELHQFAAIIASQPANWSSASQLSFAMRCWLDRGSRDAQLVEMRQSKQWQPKISEQFSTWLNRQLQHKKLPMGDVEYGYWNKLLTRELRLLQQDLEVLA